MPVDKEGSCFGVNFLFGEEETVPNIATSHTLQSSFSLVLFDDQG